MKDKKLLFDHKCHVLYSKPCKKEILAKIALHYPEAERETVWEKVQRQYAVFLSDWRTDLGGKKNFHNGVGGTYDCIAILSYYVVCKAVTSFREIEEMEENLILPTFRKLKFVDCNKPFWAKQTSASGCAFLTASYFRSSATGRGDSASVLSASGSLSRRLFCLDSTSARASASFGSVWWVLTPPCSPTRAIAASKLLRQGASSTKPSAKVSRS